MADIERESREYNPQELQLHEDFFNLFLQEGLNSEFAYTFGLKNG